MTTNYTYFVVSGIINFVVVVVTLVYTLAYQQLLSYHDTHVGLYSANGMDYTNITDTICAADDYEKVGKYGFCDKLGAHAKINNIIFSQVVSSLVVCVCCFHITYICVDIIFNLSSKSVVYRISHTSVSTVSTTNAAILLGAIHSNEWFQSLQTTELHYMLDGSMTMFSSPMQVGSSLVALYVVLGLLIFNMLISMVHVLFFNIENGRVGDLL